MAALLEPDGGTEGAVVRPVAQPRLPETALEYLIDALPQIITALDREGRVVFRNRYWFQHTGADPERAPDELVALVHPDDQAPLAEAWRSASSTGQIVELRFRLRRRDGVFCWFACRMVAIDVPDQRLASVVVLFDIQDLVALERATAESQARFHQIVEHATEGIWTTDSTLRTTFVNPRVCEILGHEREEMLGTHAFDYVFPEDQAEAQSQLEQAGAGGPTLVERQRRLRRKDGRGIWVNQIVRSTFDERGHHSGNLMLLTDIDAWKRTEETLRIYSERHQALSRGMLQVQERERRKLAHDLRAQIGEYLSVVSDHLAASHREVGGPAQARLKDAIGSVTRALDQVRTMSLALRPAVLDEQGLAAAVRWYLEAQAERTGLAVHLTLELEGRLAPSIEIACFRIVQEAFNNVIRHARAHQVWVTLIRKGGRLELLVRDDGVGFDQEVARNRAALGVSVGLIGMRERASLAGGQFAIESTPRSGTEIRVTIPIRSAVESAEE